MTLRIFKYQVEVSDEIKIEMPKGATVLTVQSQREVPFIWAIVDDSQPITKERSFRLFGTGHPMDIEPTLNRYVGTFQLGGGTFIGHLFELT